MEENKKTFILDEDAKTELLNNEPESMFPSGETAADPDCLLEVRNMK